MWTSELPQEGRFVGEADSAEGGLQSALAFPITRVAARAGSSSSWAARSCTRMRNCTTPSGSSAAGSASSSTAAGTEEELREAEEQLRLATEAGRVGLLDWDVLADERRCSGAMAEIYGYPPGEFNLSYEELPREGPP